MFDKMYESDTILICLTKCISVSSERLILAKNRLLHSIQHVKISWSRWSVCLSVTLFCPILIFTKVTQVWTRGTRAKCAQSNENTIFLRQYLWNGLTCELENGTIRSEMLKLVSLHTFLLNFDIFFAKVLLPFQSVSPL
jgi:hypothetical protein